MFRLTCAFLLEQEGPACDYLRLQGGGCFFRFETFTRRNMKIRHFALIDSGNYCVQTAFATSQRIEVATELLSNVTRT